VRGFMKGIIFDMDGVLIDSEPQQVEFDIKILSRFGIKSKPEDFVSFTGVNSLKVFEFFQKKYNLDVSAEQLYQMKKELIVEEFKTSLHIMPKFEEMKEALALIRGAKFAIASSSPRALVDVVIKQLGFEDFLSASITGDEVFNSKPLPEIYHKAAALLNLDEKDCLVLEDSKNGIKSALDAGMEVVGFFPPNSNNKDYSQVKYKITSLDEFPFYVQKFVNMSLS